MYGLRGIPPRKSWGWKTSVFISTRAIILGSASSPSVTWIFFPALETRYYRPSVQEAVVCLPVPACPLAGLPGPAQCPLPMGSCLTPSPWLPSSHISVCFLSCAPIALFTSVAISRTFSCSDHRVCSLYTRPYLWLCLILLLSSWMPTAFFMPVASASSTSLTPGSSLLNASWWMNTYDKFISRGPHKNVFLSLRNRSEMSQ